MHLSLPMCLLFAAFTATQSNRNNVVNNPPGGIQATAGKPVTVSWANPSDSTVTIKIRSSDDVSPEGGMIVAQEIENTGGVTFVVPKEVPMGEVFVQIVNDSDEEDQNFSNGFEVAGATNEADDPSTTATAEASAVPALAAEGGDMDVPSSGRAGANNTKTNSSTSSGSTSPASANEDAAPVSFTAEYGLPAAMLAAAAAALL